MLESKTYFCGRNFLCKYGFLPNIPLTRVPYGMFSPGSRLLAAHKANVKATNAILLMQPSTNLSGAKTAEHIRMNLKSPQDTHMHEITEKPSKPEVPKITETLYHINQCYPN
jgi:hypothetical protein